jgi:hypothetical protein
MQHADDTGDRRDTPFPAVQLMPISEPSHSLHDDPSDGTHWILWVTFAVVAVLTIGSIVPTLLVLILALAALAGAVALAVVIPLFLRKFLRENTSEEGFLHAWRPTRTKALRVAARTLLSWIPFGLLSVLIFSVNGLLVQYSTMLLKRGLESCQGTTAGVAETVDRAWAEAPFWVRWIPGNGAELIHGTADGLRSFENVLGHLLVVLTFLLVLEGILGWIFLLWLTIRSVTYLYARNIVAELSRTDAPRSAVTHFRMGLLR